MELSGHAKKKSTPIIREQYNTTKADINADSRSFLLKKISNNVNNLDNNKSIVPTDIEVESRLFRGKEADRIR